MPRSYAFGHLRHKYTSKIKIPVYASWKCEDCGEVNFALGSVVCQRSKRTGSWLSSTITDAQDTASTQAHLDGVEIAWNIIQDPKQNSFTTGNHFRLKNAKCTQCGKNPSWNAYAPTLSFVAFAIPIALISGIFALAKLTSIVSWLLFIASVNVIIWGLSRKTAFQKRMHNLPKEYIPVVGSFNPDLIKYAQTFSETIRTPDECIVAVRGYHMKAGNVEPFINPAYNEPISLHDIPTNFCRKCGTKLEINNQFCPKCRINAR